MADATTTETSPAAPSILDYIDGADILRPPAETVSPDQSEEVSETSDEEITETPATAEETKEDAGKPENPKAKSDWPDSARARVDALTSKARTAEERATTAEARASALEATLQQQTAHKPTEPAQRAATQNPLDAVTSPEDLQRLHLETAQWKEWAFVNLDGGTIKGADGEDHDLSAEQVRRLLATLDKRLTIDLPAKAQELQMRDRFQTEAREKYQQFFAEDSDAEEVQQFRNVRGFLADRGFANFPDLDLIAARYLVGERAERDTAKPPAATPPKATVPALHKTPVAPNAPRAAAATIPKPGANRNEALQQALNSGGKEDDLANLLMAGSTH